jgi:hypothetical protein
MGKTCGTHGRDGNCYRILVGNRKGQESRMRLKYITGKYVGVSESIRIVFCFKNK